MEKMNLVRTFLKILPGLRVNQERILSVISQCDYAVDMVIDEYKEEAEKCNLLTVYEALKKVSLLQSGSDFVELEKDKSSEEVPQDLYADEVCRIAY